MASNIEIKWHYNNQNGIDLLYDGYILPKLNHYQMLNVLQ
jgi:hypothetical protein